MTGVGEWHSEHPRKTERGALQNLSEQPSPRLRAAVPRGRAEQPHFFAYCGKNLGLLLQERIASIVIRASFDLHWRFFIAPGVNHSSRSIRGDPPSFPASSRLELLSPAPAGEDLFPKVARSYFSVFFRFCLERCFVGFGRMLFCRALRPCWETASEPAACVRLCVREAF